MLKVIIFLITGMLMGFILRRNARLISLADKLTTITIYLFLFVLGVSVGINEEIVQNLAQLGLQALILAVSGILGSVLLAYFVFIYFFKASNNEK